MPKKMKAEGSELAGPEPAALFSKKKLDGRGLQVKPFTVDEPLAKDVLGSQVIPKLYSTTFICAPKGQGKTTTLWHIIKNCADKESMVLIFSNTVYSDSSWEYILSRLKKRGVQFQVSNRLEGGEGPSPGGSLSETIAKLQGAGGSPRPEGELEDPSLWPPSRWAEPEGPEGPGAEGPEKARKLISPKYLFIFDDVSEELKQESIKQFIKQHRHYKTKVVISSQVPIDLDKGLRRNMDQWILFGGHNHDRLRLMYDDMNLSMEFALFQQLYYEATSKKYNFLNVFLSNPPVFKINFDTLLELPPKPATKPLIQAIDPRYTLQRFEVPPEALVEAQAKEKIAVGQRALASMKKKSRREPAPPRPWLGLP